MESKILRSFSPCGNYMPLSDDKHRFVRDTYFAHWKSETTSETFFFSGQNFFPDKKFFPDKIYFSRVVSRTEFCLGLHAAVFRMQSVISK